MRAVKSKDTAPELALRRALWALGVRGWRVHRRDVPGRPDIAFGPARLAVFVDGAFWHGRPDRYWPGRSSTYWDAKIARNQKRDREADSALRAIGWEPLRIWDDEVMADPETAARKVVARLYARDPRKRPERRTGLDEV